MKKVFEIKREDAVIRIEIPQVSEDFWLVFGTVVSLLGLFRLLASVV